MSNQTNPLNPTEVLENTPGEILKAARERLGLDSVQLANRSRMAWEFVHEIEVNLVAPRPILASPLLDAYELTADERRAIVGAWSGGAKAEVAAWDALCPLSDQDIQALIENLKPGDKVGPFTCDGRDLDGYPTFSNPVSRRDFDLTNDELPALIKLCGITKAKEEENA